MVQEGGTSSCRAADERRSAQRDAFAVASQGRVRVGAQAFRVGVAGRNETLTKLFARTMCGENSGMISTDRQRYFESRAALPGTNATRPTNPAVVPLNDPLR